uniref:uncharacterized protein C19orf47 homolog isoform X4 n=1 Tax=Pristiophorus japonicus TaxID=55135 RepID=UPI00398EF933
MVSVTLATSEWIQFFKDAGIPAGPAVNYAVSFVDNRIQKNMLMDLTKDIMNELGISVVGDIIAILKHAKVVYKQHKNTGVHSPSSRAYWHRSSELAKVATESISPSHANVHFELKRTGNSLLSRPADPGPDASAKRRRVTAEMEGKYIINMPKGTTEKTKKILEQQATQGLPRMSVFDRLGAEAKADTTTGSKPTGVFSRLGEVVNQKKEGSDDDDAGSVLQYAGVLKRSLAATAKEGAKLTLAAKVKVSAAKAKPAVTTIRRLAVPKPSGRTVPGLPAPALAAPALRLQPVAQAKVSVRQRLGKAEADTQDNKVTSTKSRGSPEFTVTIKNTARPAVSAKVSSSTEGRLAQMDSTGTVSVFERLGKKLN